MQGFDLVKEARKCAARRSGLRFGEDEPAMALLMMMAERWTRKNCSTHGLRLAEGRPQPLPPHLRRLAGGPR